METNATGKRRLEVLVLELGVTADITDALRTEHSVHVASTGEEARREIENQKYNVVITEDNNSPELITHPVAHYNEGRITEEERDYVLSNIHFRRLPPRNDARESEIDNARRNYIGGPG